MIESYNRLIEWVDRRAMLIRLAIAFVGAWAIHLSQVLTLDTVPPDQIDKGMFCLYALGRVFSMDVVRSLFPWVVAAQVVGIVLIALRIKPLVWVPLVVVPLFWRGLVAVCPAAT